MVDVAFTDRHGGASTPPYDFLDLGGRGAGRADELATNLAIVARKFAVTGFALMPQLHGRDVGVVVSSTTEPQACDALVTSTPDVALCVRAADCVPVVLADSDRGVIGVAHAGRRGVVAGVVESVLETMSSLGARRIEAWIGPHICGGCYEVPTQLRADVVAVAGAAFACTTWGTASLDLGAAVTSQLAAAGCTVTDLSRCTRETGDLYSYRRDGDRSGRSAGLVVLRSPGGRGGADHQRHGDDTRAGVTSASA